MRGFGVSNFCNATFLILKRAGWDLGFPAVEFGPAPQKNTLESKFTSGLIR